MRRVLFISFLIFLLNPALIFAQRDSLRRTFLDAESWFLFEEYADALPLYETLLESDPGNDNLKYKIGICLLNDPYQKDKSIQYLLDASKNINPDYKPNNLKERAAPTDVLYYLGNAYLVNELLDQAIETFEKFREVMDLSVYDEELVLAQISSCKNAQRLKTMPMDMDLLLLDSLINTRYPDVRPVVSGDGTKMAFVTELPFYDGTFYTEKTEDGWSYPQMITQMMGFDSDVYPVALSYDGTEMILYFDDDYIGNLYYSRLVDGLWTPASKLGDNISTKYWESHASFSKDGMSLYFTSNRKGGYGGLDIYLSEKQPDGSWGPPLNLGSTVNTRYNEESPHISEDGLTLYFSSYGHYNMGGYDIFYTKKKADGSWAEPVNLGYPINTTDDDLYFQPIENGNAAYYSIYSPRGIGQHDIYYMNIYSVNNPRYYLVSGKLHTENGADDASLLNIYVVDAERGDTVEYGPLDEEGSFAISLKQGIYELHFQGEGYQELIRPLHITMESDKSGIRLDDDLVMAMEAEEAEADGEVEVFEGDDSQIKLRETLVEEPAGKPYMLPVVAPRGSTLVVRTYQDSVLIRTDTLVTEKRRTQVQIVPLPGSSEVELELSDKDGNIHRNRIVVVGSITEEQEARVLTEAQEAMETQEIPDELLVEEEAIGSSETGTTDPVEILLLEMQSKSEGELQNYLLELDPADKPFESRKDLFLHLYTRAGPDSYAVSEVDVLLTEVLSGGDADHLRQYLLENSKGELKSYLEQLDMEAVGIRSSEDLLTHLANAAEAAGFSMEEVREVLLNSLGKPLEVNQLYEKALQLSEGKAREILESTDLKGSGIYSTAQFIGLVDSKLEEQGISRKEKEQILSRLFGEQYSRPEPGTGRKGWPLVVVIVVAVSGLTWFFIAGKRRRKNE